MEGPTPVSALIHAATLVTAGVYLLLRLSFLLEFTCSISLLMLLFGALTSLFSATFGMLTNDIKGIIAYSTCSQLGYMVSCCGTSGYNIALFHLINHGFFKSLLFLCAGLIIHDFIDEQDLRKMGGAIEINQPIHTYVLIGSLSLIGFPYLSGFYSKDLMLEYLYSLPFFWANLLYHLDILTLIFTSFYSFRLIFYFSLSAPKGPKALLYNICLNLPFKLKIIFTSLVFFSLFSGYILKEPLLGIGSLYLTDSIPFNGLLMGLPVESEFNPLNNLWFALFSTRVLPIYLITIGVLSFFLWAYRPMDNFFNLIQLFKPYNFIYLGFCFNYTFIRIFCYNYLH